jgi:hypothetical protein
VGALVSGEPEGCRGRLRR